MAQKKTVSVSPVASKPAQASSKSASTRTKPAATKKSAARPAAANTGASKAATKSTVKAVSKAPTSKTPAKAAAKPVGAKSAGTAARKPSPTKTSPARAAAKRKAASSERPAKAVAAAVAGGAKRSSPMAPKDLAGKTVEAKQAAAAAKKPVSTRHGFKMNEYVVYPAHGVGRIIGIEEQEIAGMSLELFVITFDKDKMTLRVPTGKLDSVGMRKLSDGGVVEKAMVTLKGRARIKRTMWSRRAQEYEAKINSGDLIAIAEVVRDLYRSDMQPEQSYSERQLYEAALDRMAREIAAVEQLDERGATQRITDVLSKSAKGRRMAEEAASDDNGAAAA